MIPNITIFTDTITETTYPNNTYKIDRVNVEDEDDHRINGYVDTVDALLQSIYLILSTERYRHLIYSWDYGVELADLVGQPMPYVMAEIPRRVTEALTQDDRINDVTDFEFEIKGKTLHTTFVVVSDIGNITTNLEVTI